MEGGGRNHIRSQPHEAPGGSLCVENRNHNAERSRGGRGGKEKVTPEDIKSLWTVRVHVCESEEKLCVVEPGLEPKQTACKWRTGR